MMSSELGPGPKNKYAQHSVNRIIKYVDTIYGLQEGRSASPLFQDECSKIQNSTIQERKGMCRIGPVFPYRQILSIPIDDEISHSTSKQPETKSMSATSFLTNFPTRTDLDSTAILMES